MAFLVAELLKKAKLAKGRPMVEAAE